MIIISIDPGKATGVAVWCDEPIENGYFKKGFTAFEVDVPQFKSFLAFVCTMSTPTVEFRFVSESFLITAQTAKNTQAPWSLKHIGAFEFVADVWFQQPVTLQAPNVGKTFGTDAKLRHVGWFTRGKGHANDASRHLITYVASRGLVLGNDTLRELADV